MSNGGDYEGDVDGGVVDEKVSVLAVENVVVGVRIVAARLWWRSMWRWTGRCWLRRRRVKG